MVAGGQVTGENGSATPPPRWVVKRGGGTELVKEGDKASFLSSFFGSPAVRPKPPSYSTASQRRCRNGKEGAKMEKKKKKEKVFFRPFSSSSGMMHRSGTTSPSPPLFSSCPFAPPANLSARKGIGDCDGAGKVCFPPSGPPCMYGTSGGGPIKEFRLGALGGRRRGGENESSRPAIPCCRGRNRTLLWEGSGPTPSPCERGSTLVSPARQ